MGKGSGREMPFASILAKTTQNVPYLLGFSIFKDFSTTKKKIALGINVYS